MSIREFIDYINNKNNSNKDSELIQLYKNPVPEKKGQMPVTQVFKKNIYHQADLLFMPEDKKYKYILVVVDLFDGRIDCEPLKTKSNKSVIDAFTKIYSRKYLKFPVVITMDQGKEFKGKTKKFFNDNNTNVKYALTNRHRQVSTVERANQKIQTILFKRMANQELITGEVDKQWVEDLKPLKKVLNKIKKIPLKKEIYEDPIVDKYTGKLLIIGQKVRIQLDYPINTVNNKRINGTFRSSDIKFSPKIYEITEVILKPGYPPMYLTSNNDMVARTKNQLQVVSDKEKEPDVRFLRGNPEHFIIKEILDKRIRNRKTEYKVRWKGFPLEESSWIPASEFNRTKELKTLMNKFNEQFK